MGALGKAKTGGRRLGTKNRATAAVKALAQKHGRAAMDKLVTLMDSADERVQLAAVREVLDRGYGRPTPAVTGGDGGPDVEPVQVRFVMNVPRESSL